MKRFGLLLLLSTLLPACGSEEPKKESVAESAKADKSKKKSKKSKKKPKKKKAKAAPLSRETPKTRLKAVPVPEDLEDEASRTVAMENLEAELDRLEAEIVGVPN